MRPKSNGKYHQVYDHGLMCVCVYFSWLLNMISEHFWYSWFKFLTDKLYEITSKAYELNVWASIFVILHHMQVLDVCIFNENSRNSILIYILANNFYFCERKKKYWESNRKLNLICLVVCVCRMLFANKIWFRQ